MAVLAIYEHAKVGVLFPTASRLGSTSYIHYFEQLYVNNHQTFKRAKTASKKRLERRVWAIQTTSKRLSLQKRRPALKWAYLTSKNGWNLQVWAKQTD